MKWTALVLLAAGGSTQEGFLHENKPENLKALFERLQKANAAGDAPAADALARPLLPNFDRARKAFRADLPKELADGAAAFYAEIARVPAGTSGSLFKSDKAQTQVNVHAATTEEIIAYAKDSTAFNEFPGGARRVAETYLKPGITFYEVEFVVPGKPDGMKYHLFFWDGERWTMIGPLWRIPPKDVLEKRKEALSRQVVLTVGLAARQYRKREGKLPEGSAAEMVKVLTSGTKPLLDPKHIRTDAKGEPIDPWDRPLVYRPGNRECFLYGWGPDGKDDGGGGDDSNWNRVYTEQALRWAAHALEIRKTNSGAHPETEGFTALVKELLDPNLNYAPPPADSVNAKNELLDGWDKPVVYRKTTSGYELRSCGPNGVDDGGKSDDVTPQLRFEEENDRCRT